MTVTDHSSAAASRPLRVTVVTSFGVLGGAERWLLAVLDATQRLDVDVIMLGEGPLRARLAARDVAVRVLETGRRAADIAAAAVRVARMLRADRPEVVLANGVKAAAVALPASRALGVGALWVKHDLSFDRLLAGPLGRLADDVVAVSARAGQAVRRSDVVVIPPPRPATPPADRDEARRFWLRRGVDLTRPTVAVATRLLPFKGVDDLLQALTYADAEQWALVVVGDDDYAAPGETRRLAALVRRLGLDGRVHFAGAVDDAGTWLAAFDAVAVLTRRDDPKYGGEGFSLTALEAVLADVPVICTTQVPAATDVISDAVVVEPGDHAAIAAALAKVLATPAASGRHTPRLVDDHPDATTVAAAVTARLAAISGRPGAGLPATTPVSVVTTVLDERNEITRLCETLLPQLQADDEFVLVDGGSTDGTLEAGREWACRDGRVRLLEVPGANIAAGRNAGIEAARHPVVAFTDAGCVPMDGWLDALRAGFAEAEPPDVVTGVYRVAARSPLEHAVAAACYPQPDEARRRGPLVRWYGRLFGVRFEATMPTGRSMAASRARLLASGGFDMALATAEDVTVGRVIARGGGHCVLAVDAAVTWWQRPTMRSQVRMWSRYGYGDGQSGDRLLIARNGYRALAYAVGAALLRHRTGRRAGLLAAAAYLSLPVARVLRQGRPMSSLPLLPVALAAKDLAKVLGCARGLLGTAAAGSSVTLQPRRAAARRRARRTATGHADGEATRVAVLLPAIGLDGRSRVLASVVVMLNRRGVVPDIITFSDEGAVSVLDDFVDTELRYVVRRLARPLAARGALLSDLALSASVRRLPTYAAYVMCNTPDIGLGPETYVLRYVTFPTERIREFEDRYGQQPYRSFGAVLAVLFRVMTRRRTPAGAWLANSDFVRDLTIEAYDLAPSDVDVLYGPATLPAEPSPAPRGRRVVSVGGFHPDKRQLEQLDIAAMLPDVEFVLVGSARSARYLRSCRRRAAALPNVTLRIDATRAELETAMRGARVFLHTKHYEHQGLSTVEGIGHGCIPVVHDSGGQREVVPDPDLRFSTGEQAARIIRAALDGAFDDRMLALRRHAEAFGEAAFDRALAPYMDRIVARVR